MNKVLRAGLIGCGNISKIYLENGKKFPTYEIVACADLDIERAQKSAEEYNIARACTTEELLADPTIDLVINLTIPSAHAKVALAALASGKHVYGEKPLSVSREDGQKILELAKQKQLYIGNAPDTFLGGGIQTCRKLIDDGWIGESISATAFMMNRGHEHWHPDPAFYYQEGGGPMFDMGPYYITALVSLLGPIERVTGSTRVTFPERKITSQPKFGEKIQVNTPTQINGVIDFQSGAIASIITSFDTLHHRLPNIEIYGTEGSLVVPDPNTFGGGVLVRRSEQTEWTEVPLTHGFTGNSRGLGVADLAFAIYHGTKARASGDLAYHVLDVMHGFHDSSKNGRHYQLLSSCEQPEALPVGINEGNFMDKLQGNFVAGGSKQ
ncbi:Gfo/Idh/MocA family protein [Aquibacillus salsiterrae]|uniref:Gfo/Idh/MocA family oxidoreductase n=1 Tax=Aquibacillus salsiterrae TaxID=2950439 RepID=A0A9X3WC22_9BACI|nr:Gfo/Idh/MocA family oxidoreductase [Aquibacillus salsiterrae]MDC3416053.1 Gfo/Idh/MocA family oxidoreductase [Aquibacillus salsiterrae]